MTLINPAKMRDAGFALALWLLSTIYLGVNLAPTRLLIEMAAEGPDTAQLFYSTDGHWDERQSTTLPVFAGYNRLNFAVPGLRLGNNVRFDPGEHARSYRVHSAIWLRAGVTYSVPVAEIKSLRRDSGSLAVDAAQLELDSDDSDPQLMVPCPSWAWTFSAAAIWPGLPTIGLLLGFIGLRRNVGRLRMAGVFLAASACFYFFYCMRFGPQLPYFDDWRYLTPDSTDLVDGGWEWMTVASNDTFFLTGQVFDFLLLKLSNVDFTWVRVFGLALLMLQLAAQYRVISRVAREQTAVAAIAVALGCWLLTNNGYWGAQALAYQQGLPTLFGTLCLVQLFGRSGEFNAHFSSLLLAACCVAAGVSYISGAPLLMSLGVACVLQARRFNPRLDPAARAGWILLGIGLASLILQLVLVTQRQGSLLEHNSAAVAPALPNDRRYWLFFFALYGRALGYAGTSALIDVGLAVMVLLPGVFFGIRRLAAGVKDTDGSREIWPMLAIYAGIGSVTYAAIVAFGRAGFIPVDASTADAVAFGKSRFHYWPIAAMLPYAWLGWAAIAQRLRHHPGALRAAAAGLMLLPKSLAVFDQNPSFLYAQSMGKRGAHCVVAHLADIDAGRPVACVEMTGGTFDVGPVILRLRARNSPTYERFLREAGAPYYREHGDIIFRDRESGGSHSGH